jgi:hypothetical protein
MMRLYLGTQLDIYFDMENYPKWLNNLIYFLAGIGFYGVLIYFL